MQDETPHRSAGTPHGSLRGEILQILVDGRVQWRAETGTLFTGLPKTLQLDE